MKNRRKVLRRAVLFGLLGVLAAGIAAPYLSADVFKPRIRNSLERGLNRRVEIQGKVYFNLFTGPGFSVSDVLIHEDPRAGIEPFAYVDTLEARVRLRSLFRGRLEFSTLRLIEPSVNLVKVEGGSWNILPFLERTVAATSAEAAHFPAVQVRAGRLNFKFGDTKSVFYITNADVDLYPASEAGEAVGIAFVGEPARTDRPAHGFGRFSGRGQWKSVRGRESEIALNLQLEKSNIADISMLMHGRDIGLHGLVASRARIAGPLSNLQITGQLQVEDIHRWDLLPARGGGLPFDYTGRLDLRAQQLEIATAPGTPLGFRVRASDFMTQPRWSAEAALKDAPLSAAAEVMRHMGAPLPAGLAMEGTLEGVVGISESGVQGQMQVRNASLGSADSEQQVRCQEAQLLISSNKLHLQPASIEIGEEANAELEVSWTPGPRVLDIRLSARSMGVRELLAGSRGVLGTRAIPLMEQFEKGLWTGSIRYHAAGDEKPQWSGNFDLRNTTIALPGLADPVQIASASVALEGARAAVTRLRARAGKTRFEGDYRYVPETARPHRLRVDIAEADAIELERVLMPTLARRQSFLQRTLRIGSAPVPEWLRARRVEGVLRIGVLKAGDAALGPVRARLVWDGTRIDLMDLEAHQEEAVATGRMTIRLAAAVPEYTLAAKLRGLSWHGGTVEAEATLQTSGVGIDVLQNLQAEGSFQGQSIEVVPENEFRTLAGDYQFSLARGIPKLMLSALQVGLGPDTFSGQGATLSDGKFQCDLSSGRKQVRIAGTLFPLKLDLAAR